ncbi:alpha-mannosidase [Treponema parvum]|uniref:alpha-mannosidase n=1 Tax=Treponema parvum TaxID=138851 RepID=UPI001AEBAEC4|nr:alpha-mannosidase [Treponema parvum]QTQ15913.1 alpha-mannosidase [Treponema parvum]
MYFYDEKIAMRIAEIQRSVYAFSLDLNSFMTKKGNDSKDMNCPIDDSWKKYTTDKTWGGFALYQWFRTEIVIPESFVGKKVAFFLTTPGDIAWKVSAEYSVYINGKFAVGFDVFHNEVILSENAVAGEKYQIAVMGFSGYNERRPTMECKLVAIDQAVRDYYFDLKVAYECSKQTVQKEDPVNYEIKNLVNESVNMVDFRKRGSEAFRRSVIKADDFLKKNLYKKMKSESNLLITAIGHSHLDVAWLWRLEQTREKAARDFGTVDYLMDMYPDFKFIQSQPQLYAYTKEQYPELYERVKRRVAEKRIEPEGGMWIEADCNCISGESMIRQFLLGKKFFRDEFNVENRILWLPDVFGYSAAMPQILKGCGIKYFMTTKISWNQFNLLPVDTFYFQGIDGTKILTHFMTTPSVGSENKNILPFRKTYNGVLCPETVAHSWDTYKQKNANSDLLLAFGYGDGGGGPTFEMLENAKRLESFPLMPKVRQEFALPYFERLEKHIKGKNVPTWVGELYLEFHRGTYTSQGRNKRANRKSEFLFQNVEAASVLALLLSGSEYPAKMLDEDWKIILLNQFHDILPGSAIGPVYEDSQKQYAKIMKEGSDILDSQFGSVLKNIKTEKPGLVVFNLNSVSGGLVKASIPAKYNSIICGSDSYPIQHLSDGSSIVFIPQVPSYGYKTFELSAETVKTRTSLKHGERSMENRYYKIKFNKNYHIISIFDKQNKREVLPKNAEANVLQSFEDKPMNYDAWDIDIYYTEKCWNIDDVSSAQMVESGNTVQTLRIVRKYLSSVITQDISIYDLNPRIDFVTTVDWHEHEILLKAAFPIAVNASRATYEIQFGYIERNTHSNTSWDTAKFEVCAHRWADLGDSGYGAALMNDCKYGYDINGTNMRITLLKSGIYPDPQADQGIHVFTYSFYPHAKNFIQAKVIPEALSLNNPMYGFTIEKNSDGKLAEEFSIVSPDNDSVIISSVKRAEDAGNENVFIIRIYESTNAENSCKLTFYKTPSYVAECNMIEQEDRPIRVKENILTLTLRPFEIKTLKVKF